MTCFQLERGYGFSGVSQEMQFWTGSNFLSDVHISNLVTFWKRMFGLLHMRQCHVTVRFCGAMARIIPSACMMMFKKCHCVLKKDTAGLPDDHIHCLFLAPPCRALISVSRGTFVLLSTVQQRVPHVTFGFYWVTIVNSFPSLSMTRLCIIRFMLSVVYLLPKFLDK